MTKHTVNQRFNSFLEVKKFSQKMFSDLSGIDKGTVSNISNGSTKQPKADFFQAIAEHFPEINLRWLLIGEGQMLLSNTEMQQAMIAKEPESAPPGYEKPDHEMLKLVKQLTEMLAEEQRSRRAMEEKLGKMETELLVVQRQMKSLEEALSGK